MKKSACFVATGRRFRSSLVALPGLLLFSARGPKSQVDFAKRSSAALTPCPVLRSGAQAKKTDLFRLRALRDSADINGPLCFSFLLPVALNRTHMIWPILLFL
jgi:hypothetical protein